MKALDKEKVTHIHDTLNAIDYIESSSSFGSYSKSALRLLKGTDYGFGNRELVKSTLAAIQDLAADLCYKLHDLKITQSISLATSRKGLQVEMAFLREIIANPALPILEGPLGRGELYAKEPEVKLFLDDLSTYQNSTNKELLCLFSPEFLESSKIIARAYIVKDTLKRGGSWFIQLKANLRARKAIKPFLKGKVAFRDSAKTLLALAELCKLKKRLSDSFGKERAIFGEYLTDLDAPASKLDQIIKHNFVLAASLTPINDSLARGAELGKLIGLAKGMNNPLESCTLVNIVAAYYELQKALGNAFEAISFDTGDIDDSDGFYDSLGTSISQTISQMEYLSEWSSINRKIKEALALGLKPVVDAWAKGTIAGKDFASAFDCNACLGIATLGIREQNLSGFSGLSEDATIKQYVADVSRFRLLSIAQLRAKLASIIPSANQSLAPTSELGLLKKAILSNGRGKSIRTIMDQDSNLIRALRPCFLMSPMSAATFLSLDLSPFDIVIFDEASQMPTAEAVGPISRGKSLVVCGDPKQLPPTSFFKSSVNSDDDEDFNVKSLASVLDDCGAISLPQNDLNWHYRSRSESLIAFSNLEFYGNRLFTFPSVDDKVSMVKFVNVAGCYDRIKTRTNEREADAIVAQVEKRLRNPATRKQSIGIVAFSIAQSSLISDKLDTLFAADDELNKWANDVAEPVFVKNLENVQGDERDVIMFSICYGYDRDLKLHLNFGPINRANGYRRLNVAISRARKEMLVFSNIDPEKIDPDSYGNSGVKYLFRFLRYAKAGRSALVHGQAEIQRQKLVIANALAAKLSAEGIEAVTDVGDSRFRLDIALLDPTKTDRYVLGVMIEGEQSDVGYSLDDKVCIQPSILTGLGWNIIRVFVYDWINEPGLVVTKIKDAYRKALSSPDTAGSTAVDRADEANSEVRTYATSGAAQIKTLPKEERKAKGIEEKPIAYLRQSSDYFQPAAIASTMDTIVQDQGPISEEQLRSEVAFNCSIARMGSIMKEKFQYALTSLERNYQTTSNADQTVFIWKRGQDPAHLGYYRKNTAAYFRNIDDIPREEMALAIYDILIEQYAMDREGLAKELLKHFLVHRDTGKYTSLLLDCIDWALENRKDLYVPGENGRIVLRKQI